MANRVGLWRQKKIIATILLALALSTAALGQKQTAKSAGPSLSATLDWIKHFLDDSPGVTSDSFGDLTVITSFSNMGCKIQWKKTSTQRLPASGNDSENCEIDRDYDYKVDLSDVDPLSVKTDPNDEQSGKRFYILFAITDSYHAIYSRTRVTKDTCNLGDENEEGYLSHDGLAVSSAEAAQRVAKALHHAVILCGGKPSAF